MTRVPYAERSDVLERYCTCTYRETSPSDGASIVVRIAGRLWRPWQRDARCPLHGDNPVHDVPEGW